ncbi:hypothetical protein ACFVY4_04470 [Streptomyces sp. NPDC058299]|uniref:hypothetical protein n=1 Tax=Streptomyces sp. NPDC058299 TaxID=3346435 RepID=UPI0036EB9488
MTNILVTVESEATARAVSYLTCRRAGASVPYAGCPRAWRRRSAHRRLRRGTFMLLAALPQFAAALYTV